MRISAAGLSFLVATMAVALAGPARAGEASPFVEGRSVESWLEAYRTGDEAQRQEAYQVLRRLRPQATFAIAPLVQALADADSKVANVAIMTLAVFGSDAVPAVSGALRSPTPEVRARAAQVLLQIGPKAKAASTALASALSDVDSSVRRLSLMAISAIGSIDPAIAPSLAPSLGALLRDSDPEVRREAARLLGELGVDAKPALPQLIRALDDPDAALAAARALGRLGPAAASAVPRLTKGLAEGNDPAVRMESARTLGRIGPAAKGAIPALVELVRSTQGRDIYLESAAAGSLSAIDPKRFPKSKGD